MNLQENISRIKQVMGLKEVISVDDDSYVTMNIKNFPRYKKEVSDLLNDKELSVSGVIISKLLDLNSDFLNCAELVGPRDGAL